MLSPKGKKNPLTTPRMCATPLPASISVKGVTDAERDEAWKRIKIAARKFGVEMNEESWRELSRHGKS
jgi:hypothetical protein